MKKSVLLSSMFLGLFVAAAVVPLTAQANASRVGTPNGDMGSEGGGGGWGGSDDGRCDNSAVKQAAAVLNACQAGGGSCQAEQDALIDVSGSYVQCEMDGDDEYHCPTGPGQPCNV